MPLKTYREAITTALREAMRDDARVCVLGEDVSGGAGCATGRQDAVGGAFGVTKGLLTEFGPLRVIDMPISETAFVGAAIGASLTGLRPVVDLMFADFAGVCFDQIFNQAAKIRYMSGGKAAVPIVIRMAMGGGLTAGAQHSQTLYPQLTGIPGLKCVVPSNAYDAKGLLASAIADEDPVIFLEHKALYSTQCEVPDEPYRIPLGKASVVRAGTDVSLVTLGAMVQVAEAAATSLALRGISCEIIDLRTTSPLDEVTILQSVRRTGRLVVIDEAPPRCSIASDIAALVAQRAFASLRAPLVKLTAPHSPVPFAPQLEKLYVPDAHRVGAAVDHLMNEGG
ncbi:MAG TPA: alpha-ketoacid dehydrogenase subunit beta [Steroidobacter sp.]|uniref:alpha-ketoacid dehydrogenase subunit beta n=1 Tax=Steroidobacter sp. TaxID=1978227 RepID=UPI002EDB9A46